MVEGERAIRTLVAEFRAGWNAHDAARLASVFAEDADFTSFRGERARGRVGVRAFHAEVFESIFKESELVVDGLTVRLVRDGVASVDVWWSMSGARTEGGQLRPPRRGLMALVATRPAGRAWQILVFHNVELPQGAPGPA
jgi:uncharacterized protein (TIGR02246 family)